MHVFFLRLNFDCSFWVGKSQTCYAITFMAYSEQPCDPLVTNQNTQLFYPFSTKMPECNLLALTGFDPNQEVKRLNFWYCAKVHLLLKMYIQMCLQNINSTTLRFMVHFAQSNTSDDINYAQTIKRDWLLYKLSCLYEQLITLL